MGCVPTCIGADQSDTEPVSSQGACNVSLGNAPCHGAAAEQKASIVSDGSDAYSTPRYLFSLLLILSCLVTKQWKPTLVIIGLWCFFKGVASVCKRADTQAASSFVEIKTISESLSALEARWRAKVSEESKKVPPVKVEIAKSETGRIEWNIEGSREFYVELQRISVADLSRFLIARGGDVDKALQLTENVAKWRAAVRPSTIVLPQIANAIAQRVWRFAGWSRCGYPVLACDASLWAPSKYKSIDEYIRYVAYFLELLVDKRMGRGVTKFVTIFELSGFTMEMVRPIAMRCILNLAQIVQEVNAERAAAIYLVNTNALFRASWHMFAPLVDSRTRRKIHWLPPAENRKILGQIIDVDKLEQRFGGDFKGIYAPFQGNAEIDAGEVAPPAFDHNAPIPAC